MNISPVSQNSFSAAIALIGKNNLPTNDLSEVTKLFVLEDGDKVVGTIGLEYNGEDGLLRSLSVSEEKRNAGLGKELVNFIEDYASKHGIKNIFLLTTTADRFFTNRGYQTISRSEVSSFIQKSSEFSSVCPSSATVMKKVLG